MRGSEVSRSAEMSFRCGSDTGVLRNTVAQQRACGATAQFCQTPSLPSQHNHRRTGRSGSLGRGLMTALGECARTFMTSPMFAASCVFNRVSYFTRSGRPVPATSERFNHSTQAPRPRLRYAVDLRLNVSGVPSAYAATVPSVLWVTSTCVMMNSIDEQSRQAAENTDHPSSKKGDAGSHLHSDVLCHLSR